MSDRQSLHCPANDPRLAAPSAISLLRENSPALIRAACGKPLGTPSTKHRPENTPGYSGAVILNVDSPVEAHSEAVLKYPGHMPSTCCHRLSLHDLVDAELGQPTPPEVAKLAEAVAARHAGARAVLFYGSCLRESQLEGRMLDFYLIVTDYAAAYEQAWLSVANRLLPPNVFPIEQDGAMAKYAVLSENDFARLASAETRSVSVWARFAQPSRLVWSANPAAAARVVAAVANAAPALLAAVRPCVPDRIDALDFWARAFDLTYSAELRPERGDRARSLVDADAARYRSFTLAALASAGIEAAIDGDTLVFAVPASTDAIRFATSHWKRRRREGKALNVLRLVKASATYAGGLDYLAWKIGRHTGVRPVIRPWQRRWPLLGALIHLPRLLARGVVK